MLCLFVGPLLYFTGSLVWSLIPLLLKFGSDKFRLIKASRRTIVSPVASGQEVISRRLNIRGQIQGVGFRPFVFRVATRHGISGRVWNDGRGVTIEARGTREQLDRFEGDLMNESPPLATLDKIQSQPLDIPESWDRGFTIADSRCEKIHDAAITVDSAVCDRCQRELLDPENRYFRYGLINCTNCGPRFSILRGIPYDRPNTSMAGFTMCHPCRSEYRDPSDRRFHAQPVSCHNCGPKISLVDISGEPIHGDPYQTAARILKQGRILAVKGLGGFHLAVRADDESAVARLRRLKQRDAKPFALMVASENSAASLVRLTERGRRLLASPANPILLAPRRAGSDIAPSVAPRNHRLGVMLPYTPIPHLLMHELHSSVAAGAPPLVMTSANHSDEPLVFDNDDAMSRLSGLCDAFLIHDRPIVRPVDDSVFLDTPDAQPLPIRRARGFVPQAIPLPVPTAQPGLCVGGELKCVVAVVRNGEAILSQHLGDLRHTLAFEQFTRVIDDLCCICGVEPRWIAHDLHPAYLSTRHAIRLADELGVPRLAVQHHHAHAASMLAESGRSDPTLAMVADGVGYGDDGSSWGGELLLADTRGYRRLAALSPLRLPGGDAAATDTRRCALALLYDAFGEDAIRHPAAQRLVTDPREREILFTMIRKDVGCTDSSAAGRVFDAAAALLGVCERNRYEAEAPIRLEALAEGAPIGSEPMRDRELFVITEPRDHTDISRIELAPLTRALLTGRENGIGTARLAAMFHDQLARAFAAAIVHAADLTGVDNASLTGGVFVNQRLTTLLTQHLSRHRIRVLRHRVVPPGDGGIALGQAAIASTRFASTSPEFSFEPPSLA
ncbi:MAG: carbamoyltransferase HypF [Planctomycetota bacterium]